MVWLSQVQRWFAGSLRHPVLLFQSILLAPALWVILVGSGNTHELLAGGAASLATILFVFFVCRLSSEDLDFHLRDLVQVWRVPWYILTGVLQVSAVACQDLVQPGTAKSLYRVCGFDTSTRDPIRKARTVLAVAYTTAGPSFIVVGVDEAQSRMLFHQIARTTVPQMTRLLGAKS